MALFAVFLNLIGVCVSARSGGRMKAVQTGDVVFVQELTRHGARAPIGDVTKYIKRDWIKNFGVGELTDTGMRQHYYLGLNTAGKYASLLQGGLRYDEYYARSTGFNRTVMSAQSHLLGIMGNIAFNQDSLIWKNDDPKILPPVDASDLNFDPKSIDFATPLPDGLRPFTVHAQNRDIDLFLGADYNICPTNGKQVTKDISDNNSDLTQSPKLMGVVNEALKFYQIDKTYKGNIDFLLCYQLGDFTIQDYMNNPDAPLKPGDDLYERLSDCYHEGIANYFKT